ncbi:NAD(P)-binding domain-containing protein [Vibrio sp. V38_P2S17PM301]|uniref:FAD/NAD(P)-binding protein n=1 Tax=Vibrio sp. V38_P2S17PM301 TaxID=1938689 RepID=UPI001361A49F|nr:FAD/NAD(P)-binding protein [Vibrio sp. V38_P2S17PM301]NAX25311.1 NAD(P)-binding domain-containing protein [Vibrio sp. V38_P2S17PM301]
MEVFDVAIVGFGATGVGLLNEIQNEIFTKRDLKPTIAIFNQKDSFAKGKAFGDADSVHIVNTPPDLMSPSSVEPNSFSRWLIETDSVRSKWPSRITFAKYLEYVYQDIKKSNLLSVREFKSEVASINKTNGFLNVTMINGSTIKAREVVLCLGSLNSSNFNCISKFSGFIRHYSEFERYRPEEIIVAGTGLTAVDAFRKIEKNGKAKIHMFSRSGLAPTCLSEFNQYIPKHLTWNSLIRQKNLSPLKSFIKLLLAEHRLLQNKSEFKPAQKLLKSGKQCEYFNYLEERANNADLPWQDVLVSTRYWFHKFWKAMSLEEKAEFVSRFGSLWAAWRHPIPLSSFSQMKRAVTEGRLNFYKSLRAPDYEAGRFNVLTSGKTLNSEVFWDATGGSPIIRKSESGLLKQMILEGYAESHPCGGISVDPNTFEVIVQGENINGLYSIGPLNRGVLFSTNAFWFNAQCSEKWAHQWTKRIKPEEFNSKRIIYS